MDRVTQLSDSSSDDEDCFDDMPVERNDIFQTSFNHTQGSYDLPGPAKRRKQSTSNNSTLNDDESDNPSNYESEFGLPILRKRDQRSTSHLCEDSERNDLMHNENTFGNSSKSIDGYSPHSERERTVSRDYSERGMESNDEEFIPNMRYYDEPTERERTKSQDFEFESNEEDYLSSTSASDLDSKPSKTKNIDDSKDRLGYNPAPQNFYGSNLTAKVSLSKSYISNEDANLPTLSNKHSNSEKYDGKRKDDKKLSFTPKKRFVKSDSCDTAQSSSASDFSSFEGNRKSSDSEEEVNSGPPPKKSKSIAIKPSGAVSKMMENMGYKSGRGLGKHAQGVVEPVKVSAQRGTRGLGVKLKGLEPEDVDWDFSKETVDVIENVDWLECTESDTMPLRPPSELIKMLTEEGRLDELQKEKEKTWGGGMKKGKKKMTLDDETHFCDPKIVKKVMKNKTIFDQLNDNEMRRARDRSNPFELIRGGIFLNRAAVKMANMDKRFDFMFTKPVDQNGEPMVGSNELLYFADVCAGPGGFSEYVLWRKKWRAKGFGLTLKESNDFKLDDFYAGPCESFEPHYGVDDDGNVYSPANIESFKNLIFEQTDNKGVHFMMSDGGFSVSGNENIQEILSKRLYLCQCLVALRIVRTNGHFVTKLFDLFTPFSVGIIYLMYRCFEKVCIFKPNTSRPANSERYLVCKWKRSESVTETITEYLDSINKFFSNLHVAYLNEVRDAKKQGKPTDKIEELDITEIVLMDRLKSDQKFYDYILKSNNELARRQIINLRKVVAFVKDEKLIEPKQKELREKCIAEWEIPDRPRGAPKVSPPSSKVFASAFGKDGKMPVPAEISKNGKLEKEGLSKTFTSIYDWQCVALHDYEKTTIFYGQGRKRVHKWGSSSYSWSELQPESMLELSPGTIVYGELVYELVGEGRGLRKSCSFHIIDAYQLGDEEIGELKYSERYELCRLFCKAISKKECPVRMKTLHHLYDVNSLLNNGLVRKQLKNISIYRLCFPIPPFHYEVNSLLFMCTTGGGWCKHWSKSRNAAYYYNRGTKESKFEQHVGKEVCNKFTPQMQQLKIWSWKVYPDVQPPRAVAEKLINFLIENTVHNRQT